MKKYCILFGLLFIIILTVAVTAQKSPAPEPEYLRMHVRANEARRGTADDLLSDWIARARTVVAAGDIGQFKRHMRDIVQDFAAVPLDGVPRPKVGIVGEILLKYHPDANNNVARSIMEEGGEPVSTDLADFFLYCFLDPVYTGKAFAHFLSLLRDKIAHSKAKTTVNTGVQSDMSSTY